MRLILLWLARANLAWALADLARSARLRREADESMDRAEWRMAEASNLGARACSRR